MSEEAVPDKAAPELAVGIGMRSGTSSADILAAILAVLGDSKVRNLATVDRRAEEPGLTAAASVLGVAVVSYSAEELAEVDVPNPSDRIVAAVGAPSVAEAAAIRSSSGGELVVSKTSIGAVTVAAARPE